VFVMLSVRGVPYFILACATGSRAPLVVLLVQPEHLLAVVEGRVVAPAITMAFSRLEPMTAPTRLVRPAGRGHC